MLLQRLHDIHGWHWVRRSHEWQLAPVRVAERAELVAVRDAGGDAVEVERVGALGREDGLPPGGILPPRQIAQGFIWAESKSV
jgi:hypothetical protein